MALSGLIVKFVSPKNLRAFALWALRLLEENLDTDLKARLESYRADRSAFDAITGTVLADNAAREERLKQLAIQRSGAEQTVASGEANIRNSKEEVRRIDEEPSKVDTAGPVDGFHDDLRHRS
jgi:predicted lipid-binding transport protein (Tim44 family)